MFQIKKQKIITYCSICQDYYIWNTIQIITKYTNIHFYTLKKTISHPRKHPISFDDWYLGSTRQRETATPIFSPFPSSLLTSFQDTIPYLHFPLSLQTYWPLNRTLSHTYKFDIWYLVPGYSFVDWTKITFQSRISLD